MPMNGPARILVVEDDPAIEDAVALNLREEGFAVAVARRGDVALQMAQEGTFSLLVLDLMLPGISGEQVCRTLRRRSNVPILMLTARTREMDKVVGLEIGADDYLTKPFGMLELIARVKALLRRSGAGTEAKEEEVHAAGAVSVDVSRRQVVRDGEAVTLRPKQFELLRHLIANRGRVLPRERLLDLVWGGDEFLDTGTLDVHIRWLRQKIERDPSRPERIVTVRGVGYVYAEDAP
jgi:two-component system, OmpR family, response regulator RegX3